MNTVTILALISILELILIGILKKQLDNFTKNYQQSVLKIGDIFITVGTELEKLDGRIKELEKNNG